MSIFRKGNEKKYDVKDVYILETTIVSSINDGSGCGPLCITQYYAGTCENGKYRELFSGRKLEMDSNIKTFDIPYIVEAKPLKEYLKNPNEKTIKSELLFDFLVSLNTGEIVDMLSVADGEEEENGEE